MFNTNSTSSFIATFISLALLPFSIKAQTYSRYVGESVDVSFSVPGVLDNASWDTGSHLLAYPPTGSSSVRIYFDSYFSGTETVNCAYGYTDVSTNKHYTGHVYFYFTCKSIDVRLNASELYLEPDETYQLEISQSPSDAPEAEIHWESSNQNIVRVDEDGLIQAYNKGTATITAKNISGSNSPSCTIIVDKIDPTSISIPESIIIQGRSSVTISPIMQPEHAKSKLSWESSDINVATVNQGVITGVKSGTATITVKTANDLSASCNVIVKPVEIESVSLKNKKIYIEGEETLYPSFTPSNASEGIDDLVWSSDNPNIVQVDQKGRIYGIAQGSAIVSIHSSKDDNINASCTITVATTNYKDGTKFKAQTIEGVNLWFKVLSVADKTLQVGYYTENSNYEVTGYCIVDSYSGHLTIPSKVNGYTVVAVSDWAFLNYESDLSITIPSSVKSIGSSAFWNCKNLHSISLPSTNISLGNGAFLGCVSLTSIDIPEGVVNIASKAFQGCTSLSSVSLPTSLTSIGSYAFYGCRKLEMLSVPQSVISIGESAFINTPWYEKFPDGIVYINSILYKYKGSMPLNSSIAIKDGTTSLTSKAFYKQINLASCVVPNSVKTIGARSFYGCTNLSSIDLPSDLEKLGGRAFALCTSLHSISLPSNMSTIESYTFYKCSSLKSIRIPANIKKINYRSFYGCSSLKDVYCFTAEVPKTSTNAFTNSSVSAATLHVPASSINDYQRTDPWNDFKVIIALTDDEMTAIKEIENRQSIIENRTDDIFDLSGRRISNKKRIMNDEKLTKGVYIINGHKVLIK